MDRLRCQCGYVVETPSKFDLLGKTCPNCACILLDDLGLGRIVARNCLGLGKKKRTLKIIKEAEPNPNESISYTSESLSSEELAELEELNSLVDEMEESSNEEDASNVE